MNLALSTATLSLILGPYCPATPDVFSLGELGSVGALSGHAPAVSVEEVSKTAIRTQNACSVVGAMEGGSGVSVRQGDRGEKLFYLRGFEQKQVPVLFDGIPISVPFDGTVDAGKLPVSNVSKISVTRGLSPAASGPNAMGGAVNIVTSKPQKPFEAAVELGASEGASRNASLSAGAKQGRTYFTFDGGYSDSDGFLLPRDFQATRNEGGGLRDNSDSLRRNASAKLGYLPAKGHEVAIGVNLVDSEWGVPPDVNLSPRPRYWRFTDWSKKTYYLLSDDAFSERFSVKTRLYLDQYYNILDSYDDATYTTQAQKWAFHSTYDDHTLGASAIPQLHWPGQELSLGVHFKRDVHRQKNDRPLPWERYEAETYSLGLEDTAKLSDRLTLTAGASWDFQKPLYANGGALRASETVLNPQAGLNVALSEESRIYLNAGQKSRFPSLKELYSGYLDTKIPSPDLKTERALHTEVGGERVLPGYEVKLGASVYYSALKDLIVSKQVTPAKQQMQNVGRAVYRGGELSAKAGWWRGHWLELRCGYLDARDLSFGRTSSRLPDRPAQTFAASDLWKLSERLLAAFKLEAYSKRYYQPSAASWGALPGYWTLDANVEYALDRHASVKAGVANLADKDYQTQYGYPNPGRTFFASMRYAF